MASPPGKSSAPTVKSTAMVQRKCACGGKCPACRRKAELQRIANGSGPAIAPPIVHDVLTSPGKPMEPAVRRDMEMRLGYSFGTVRLHSDGQAAESARAVEADAYTVGRHVVFGQGLHAPRSAAGRELLTHELVHVMQQGAAHSVPRSLSIDQGRSASEREAASLGRDAHTGLAGGDRRVRRGPLGLSRKKGGKGKGRREDASGCVAVSGVGQRAKTPSGAGLAVEVQLLAECTAQTPADTMCVPNPFRLPGAGRKSTRKKGGEGVGPDILLFHTIESGAGAYEMEYAEIKPRSYVAGAKRKDTQAQHDSYIAVGQEMIDKLGEELGFRVFKHTPLSPESWTPTTPRPFLGNPKQQILHTSNTSGGLIFYSCIDLPESPDKKKKKSKKKGKKPKKPGAKGGNYGFGLSLFSTGGGAGNASFGVAIFSNGEAIGTVSAGIVYDSNGMAVGTVSAGGGISNDTIAALVASAGLARDASATAAGAAGAGTVEGSDVTAAGVAGAGKQEGATGTVVGEVGTGGAVAGGAGKGTAVEGGQQADPAAGDGGAAAAGGPVTTEGGRAAAEAAVGEKVKEAAKIDQAANAASPAQKELLDHLATLPGDERFAITEAEWIEKVMFATAGLSEEEVRSLKGLGWKPGTVTKEELRQRVQAALEAQKGTPDGTKAPKSKKKGKRGKRASKKKPPVETTPEADAEAAKKRLEELEAKIASYPDWERMPIPGLAFVYEQAKDSAEISGVLYVRARPAEQEFRGAAFFSGTVIEENGQSFIEVTAISEWAGVTGVGDLTGRHPVSDF